MHPIEHLRYVARAHDADPAMVASEAATAMRYLHSGELVVACRRVLGRHPTNGPLWWACSRILATADTARAVGEVGDALDDDPTPQNLAARLPEGASVLVTAWSPTIAAALRRRGDIAVTVAGETPGAGSLERTLTRAGVDCDQVPMEEAAIAARSCDLALVEADAMSSTTVLSAVGNAVVLAVAIAAGLPTWLVAGRGRRLPDAYVTAMLAELDDDEATFAFADRFDPAACLQIVGPECTGPPGPDTLAAECPLTPELLTALR